MCSWRVAHVVVAVGVVVAMCPSPWCTTAAPASTTLIVDREVAAESDEVDEDVDRGFEQFTIESGGGGDEFMAVKPWLGAVVAPTNPPVIPRGMPKVKLHLDWVYGYRGFDARNNVRCGVWDMRPCIPPPLAPSPRSPPFYRYTCAGRSGE